MHDRSPWELDLKNPAIQLQDLQYPCGFLSLRLSCNQSRLLLLDWKPLKKRMWLLYNTQCMYCEGFSSNTHLCCHILLYQSIVGSTKNCDCNKITCFLSFSELWSYHYPGGSHCPKRKWLHCRSCCSCSVFPFLFSLLFHFSHHMIMFSKKGAFPLNALAG